MISPVCVCVNVTPEVTRRGMIIKHFYSSLFLRCHQSKSQGRLLVWHRGLITEGAAPHIYNRVFKCVHSGSLAQFIGQLMAPSHY